MKVRYVFAKDVVLPGGQNMEHLFVVTEDGRLFEHFSDDDPDDWSEITLPTAIDNP